MPNNKVFALIGDNHVFAYHYTETYTGIPPAYYDYNYDIMVQHLFASELNVIPTIAMLDNSGIIVGVPLRTLDDGKVYSIVPGSGGSPWGYIHNYAFDGTDITVDSRLCFTPWQGGGHFARCSDGKIAGCYYSNNLVIIYEVTGQHTVYDLTGGEWAGSMSGIIDAGNGKVIIDDDGATALVMIDLANGDILATAPYSSYMRAHTYADDEEFNLVIMDQANLMTINYDLVAGTMQILDTYSYEPTTINSEYYNAIGYANGRVFMHSYVSGGGGG